MSRYTPLNRYLSALETDDQTLSFQDVERILGRPLPPSARGVHAPQWWANTSTHSQGQAWVEAGWRVEEMDPASERISFRRTRPAPNGVEEPSRRFEMEALMIDRRMLSARALRLIDDYADALDGSGTAALIRIVEDAALERRRRTIGEIAARAPRVAGDSTALIREDRDGR